MRIGPADAMFRMSASPIAEGIIMGTIAFANLTHAWTLFAESDKKADAEKRGRFNLGEKLVLSLCKMAEIETTTGGVRFDETGRHVTRKKRAAGSTFSAVIRMTQGERISMKAAIMKLIPPSGVATCFNGTEIPSRTPLRKIEATLPTEIAEAFFPEDPRRGLRGS